MEKKHTSIAEFVRRLWLRGCTVQRIENILTEQYGCEVETETIRAITRAVNWQAAKRPYYTSNPTNQNLVETTNIKTSKQQ